MLRIVSLLSLMLVLPAAYALTLDDIVNVLSADGVSAAKVRYEVYLPSAPDPVEYDISLTAVNPGDSLAPCDYLIEWTLPRADKVSNGFASYHAGNHFRYRDTRLQEYHFADDSTPFTTQGGGVQRNAQFSELLPAFIAQKLIEMTSDSSYVSTYDANSATLNGVKRVNGYDAQEYTYQFDKENGRPVQIDFVYNPASISEQTVTAYFTWLPTPAKAPVFDEAFMIDRFGDEFQRFRTSNFRVENLRGADIPTFSYVGSDNQRQSHTRAENDLGTPSLLVFVDSGADNVNSVMQNVRNATASLPMTLKTIYVFVSNSTPDSFALSTNEYIAQGASTLATRCGVTACPTFVLVGRDGRVNQTFVGLSPDTETELSQALMLLQ